MNTKLWTETKNDFEKDFFKLLTKLVTTNRRRNYLVSEPNYHMTKMFSENLLAIEIKKIKVKMNNPGHLDLSILENYWNINVWNLVWLY